MSSAPTKVPRQSDRGVRQARFEEEAPVRKMVSLEEVIETPECVRMSYRLAGPAARCGAYMLDALLRVAILLVVIVILSCSGASLPGLSRGFTLLSVFLIEWGYFAFFEWLWAGQTVGKKAMGLRVIETHGYPLSAWSAMVRNIVRFADTIGFYGPSLVSMLMSRRMQRLGDLAAGTIVIQERPVRLPSEPVILDTIRPLDRNQIGSYVPPERTLGLIDQLLSRRTNSRERIPHERGHALSRDLAMALARKLNYTGEWEQVKKYSMAFLARVYVTFLRETKDESDEEGDTVAASRKPRDFRGGHGRRPFR